MSGGAAAVDQLKVKPQTHLSAGGGSGIIKDSRSQDIYFHLQISSFKRFNKNNKVYKVTQEAGQRPIKSLIEPKIRVKVQI